MRDIKNVKQSLAELEKAAGRLARLDADRLKALGPFTRELIQLRKPITELATLLKAAVAIAEKD